MCLSIVSQHFARINKTDIIHKYIQPKAKVKAKYLWGVFQQNLSLTGDQIFHAPGAKLWHCAAELPTISATYPLCASALTDTRDNPSKMCALKLTLLPVFVPSFIIDNLTRAAYSPNGFHKLS